MLANFTAHQFYAWKLTLSKTMVKIARTGRPDLFKSHDEPTIPCTGARICRQVEPQFLLLRHAGLPLVQNRRLLRLSVIHSHSTSQVRSIQSSWPVLPIAFWYFDSG